MQSKVLYSVVLLFLTACNNKVQTAIDIDCDGINDTLYLNVQKSEFAIRIEASSNNSSSILQFGLGQSSRQDAICGLKPKLIPSSVGTIQMHIDMYGSKIEGYNYDTKCSHLQIEGGECDPITVFYNHDTKVLNWLRL